MMSVFTICKRWPQRHIAADWQTDPETANLIYVLGLCFVFPVGGGELHQLREGHQLAQLRGLRCRLQQCEQLAVDAFHRARPGQSNLHRIPIHNSGLFPVPGQRAQLQGDFLPALLRIRRGHQGAAPLGARELQADRYVPTLSKPFHKYYHI